MIPINKLGTVAGRPKAIGYIYICIYMCIYIYIYPYICIFIHMYIHT